MKKIVFLLVFLISIGLVHARVGSIDNECKQYGFDYGIAKYSQNNGQYNFDEGTDVVNITGNKTHFHWVSNVYISGVLVKAATNTSVFSGGYEGDAQSMSYNNNGKLQDISHVTFCGKDNEIPEFGVIAGIVALIGALGIFIYTRKY
ncbi:MAG: hypothetical protein KatS3mg002_1533 [Candidatus Woesearchaeota archaeon]|nr:MAG: hypothetical protein KatS3mg002_1533 [Candidatus Woesearchaeota archaeon]